MNDIEKPIELKRQELIENIVGLINEAQLPAFAVADALRNILAGVDQAAAQQYEQAKQAYEEKLKEKA